MPGLKKRIFFAVVLLIVLALLAGCSSDPKETGKLPGVQGSGSSAGQGSAGTEAKDDPQKVLLSEVLRLARQGRVINCEFPVETTVIETVKDKWGNPDKEEYVAAAKGTYVTYLKRQAAFGVNKGSQIFDVRSYHSALRQVTLSKVREVLGEPERTHHFEGEDMLVYQVSEKYQLLFLFPKGAGQDSDPLLDHYNVFYPDGTVNSMAEDPGIRY